MAAIASHFRVAEQDRGLAERTKRSIGSGRPLLAYDDEGKPFEVTGAVLETINEVLSRILESNELMLVNREVELSPEEAAKVLGVSRPMVYHRMDSKRLPFRQIGTHRRVLLKDVLKLKDFEAERGRFSEAMGRDTDEQEPAFVAP